MTQTVTLLGKKFVVILKRESDQMKAELARQDQQDPGDVAEARRRSKERTLTAGEMRKKPGLFELLN